MGEGGLRVEETEDIIHLRSCTRLLKTVLVLPPGHPRNKTPKASAPPMFLLLLILTFWRKSMSWA